MSKMSEYFTPDDEERLLDLMALYPVIYDPNCVGYKDHQQRKHAFAQISTEMQKPQSAVLKKYRYLRDEYTRKRKKGKPTERLERLRNLFDSQRLRHETINNTVTTHTTENVDMKEEVTWVAVEEENGLDIEEEDGAEWSMEETTEQSDFEQKRKRSKTKTTDTSDSEIRSIIRNISTREKTRDPLTDLFSGLEGIVRRLPPLLQNKAKRDITNLVLDLELQMLQDKSK